MSEAELSNDQLNRYSRHLLLPEIDLEGQRRLSTSRALIVGAGGLGCPAAMYLTSSGVGKITIFDDDTIDLGNLQRQIAFKSSDIGKKKAGQLRNALLAINPDIQIEAVCERATDERLNQAAVDADILIDCSDNFSSRFAINNASIATNTPLISGAAIRFQGQVTVFDPRQADSPCYQCLYHENEMDAPLESCQDRGVFAPLVGIIGSIQAAEAIKLLLGVGTSLCGNLLTINSMHMLPRHIKLTKDPQCPACARS